MPAKPFCVQVSCVQLQSLQTDTEHTSKTHMQGKCVTMEQIAKFNKQLRRKFPHTRVLMDKE